MAHFLLCLSVRHYLHSFISWKAFFRIKVLKAFQLWIDLNITLSIRFGVIRNDKNSISVKVSSRKPFCYLRVDSNGIASIRSDDSFAFCVAVIYCKLRNLRSSSMRISYTNNGFAILKLRSVYFVVFKRRHRKNYVPRLPRHSSTLKVNGGRIALICE